MSHKHCLRSLYSGTPDSQQANTLRNSGNKRKPEQKLFYIRFQIPAKLLSTSQVGFRYHQHPVAGFAEIGNDRNTGREVFRHDIMGGGEQNHLVIARIAVTAVMGATGTAITIGYSPLSGATNRFCCPLLIFSFIRANTATFC